MPIRKMISARIEPRELRGVKGYFVRVLFSDHPQYDDGLVIEIAVLWRAAADGYHILILPPGER